MKGDGSRADGYSNRRCGRIEKAASLRQQGVGNPACGRGFQTEMYGVRPSDYDLPEAGGKKYEGFEEKGLKQSADYGNIMACDTMFSEGNFASDILAPGKSMRGPKDQKEVQ